jgi:hypothetical protein
VGPRAGLDADVRGKILCLCRRLNPGRPVQSDIVLTELHRLMAMYRVIIIHHIVSVIRNTILVRDRN